jgi:hypothetical protein
MSFHHERKSGSLLTSNMLADDPPLRLARFLNHDSTNDVGTNKPSTSNYHSNHHADHLDIDLNENSTERFLRRRQPSDENKPDLIPEGTSNDDTAPRSTALQPTPPYYPPVSASTVFSRNAPPLYLPNLNDYIASFPAPHLSALINRSPSGMNMFPPMNLLENSGKTIERLERNEALAPPWISRTTIFEGLANISLGLAVRIFSHSVQLFIDAHFRVPACCRPTIPFKDYRTPYKYLLSSSVLCVSTMIFQLNASFPKHTLI